MMWQYSGAICIFCRSWSLQKRRPSISTVVWTLDDLPPHSGIQPRRNNLFLIQVSLLKWFWNAFIVNRHILYIALHCCYKKHISEVWCLHTFYPMKIAYWREGKWCVCVRACTHTHTHTHTLIHSPVYALVMFQKVWHKLNFVQVGICYKSAQVCMCMQGSSVEIQTATHWNLFFHSTTALPLCYSPALFLHQLYLKICCFFF